MRILFIGLLLLIALASMVRPLSGGGIGTLSDPYAENYGYRLRTGSDAKRVCALDDQVRPEREEEPWLRKAMERLRFSS
jgi:hypothetical protein